MYSSLKDLIRQLLLLTSFNNTEIIVLVNSRTIYLNRIIKLKSYILYTAKYFSILELFFKVIFSIL